MFALKLIAGLFLANFSAALNCGDGRSCVYMATCKGELKEGCPLAYSYRLEGDVLSIELAGYQPTQTRRYLAIGFNENEGMANARVTECSAIGNEKIPSVKLSWNKDPGTANVRIENEETFRGDIISKSFSSYENGMVYCSWKQKVGTYNNEKIFQVKAGVKYHHIVAYGETNDISLMKHQGAESTIYASMKPGALDCDNGRTCYYMKSCKGVFDQNCSLAYSFKIDGDILSMELAGYQQSGTNRYIAVGFGEAPGMAEAKVTECSAIGDEKVPSIKLSYNTPGEWSVNVRIDNEPEIRKTIISDAVSTYEDGMIYCKWKQNVAGNGNDKIFSHKSGVKYHQIAAYGPTAENGTGLDFHDEAEPTLYTDFENPNDPGEVSGKGLNCEGGRTCVYMKSCKGVFGSKCPLAYSFRLEGDILSMELAGYQDSIEHKYLAIGFGEKPGMGESKVTECSAIGTESSPTVKLSYNSPGDGSVNIRIEGEIDIRKSIISGDFVSYEDGMLYCKWKQNVSGNGNEKVFQRKAGVKYSNIIAYGPTTANGLSQHHEQDSPLITDFEGSIETGDTTSTKLLKAHGSLMMIAWLICVPTAAIFARFLRAHWPTKKPFGLAIWFHVHRTFNVLACLVIIAGFVCVFIETNWKWRGVGSDANYWVATHSTVGIIACVLAWLQPFISLLRCDPQNPRRPVFNWIHRLIGITAFLLAVTATSIASNNFPIWTEHMTCLVLALVPLGSIIVLFVVMTILDNQIRVHDANIVKIHSIRFTLVCITIAIVAGSAIALVVMLIIA